MELIFLLGALGAMFATVSLKIKAYNNPKVSYEMRRTITRGEETYSIFKLINSGVYFPEIKKVEVGVYHTEKKAKNAMKHLEGV